MNPFAPFPRSGRISSLLIRRSSWAEHRALFRVADLLELARPGRPAQQTDLREKPKMRVR